MIPKMIHYCWFGKGEKNNKILECISSWEKYCPDYQIICWDESNYDIHKNKYIEQAYEKKKWAFVSDYARVDIVYNYGGIYLDTDVELIKTLDSLLKYEMFVGRESEEYVSCGPGFGAVKGHPYLKEIMEYYEKSTFIKSDGTMDLTSCPVIQTQCLLKHGLKKCNQYQELPQCVVFQTEVLSPKSFKTGKLSITHNTISIHHFDMSWVDETLINAKNREWQLKQKYGNRTGKTISMITSGPRKLVNKIATEGLNEMCKYLIMIVKNILGGKIQ